MNALEAAAVLKTSPARESGGERYCAPGPPLPPSPLRETAGVRVAATPTSHPRVMQTFAETPSLFLPLPVGEGRAEGLPRTHSRDTHRTLKGAAVLSPLPGRERARVRVESPESLPSPEPPTPPPQRRRSSPLVMPPPAPAFRRPESPRHRLCLPLPMREGRAEGLPRTHSRDTHRTLKGAAVLFPLPGRERARVRVESPESLPSPEPPTPPPRRRPSPLLRPLHNASRPRRCVRSYSLSWRKGLG